MRQVSKPNGNDHGDSRNERRSCRETRLQTEIDRGEARLKRLRTDVALSALSLDLQLRPKPRILGPLGYLWVGTKWFVTKLFVIRE
jgi:hypothetical protein